MYPEHEKLAKIKDQSQAIGEFLEWLNFEKKMWLGEYDRDTLIPARYDTVRLLAEFFDINQKLLEEEKREMLEELRKHNGL